MSKKYYQVTDWEYWEGEDRYYSSKNKAISEAKKLFKEMKYLNGEGKVIVTEFELAKLRKPELVINLLYGHQFKVNEIEVLCLDYWHPKTEEEDGSL